MSSASIATRGPTPGRNPDIFLYATSDTPLPTRRFHLTFRNTNSYHS